MPRRKRHDTIRELHREAIRRQTGLLLTAIDAAALSFKYFTPHGEALAELRKTLIQTENILHDRPAISSAGTRRRDTEPPQSAYDCLALTAIREHGEASLEITTGNRALERAHHTFALGNGEESAMAFIASPQQLKILKQAVDDYCRDCGIVDAEERLYVADLASSLFDLGARNAYDLRRGLEGAMGV